MIKKLISFIVNGFSTFRRAAFRNYDIPTESIRKMKEDFLSGYEFQMTTKQKLRGDFNNVARDFRKAFDKYKETHEQKANRQ